MAQEWIGYFKGLQKNTGGRAKKSTVFYDDFLAFWDQTTNPEQPLIKLALGMVKDKAGNMIPGIVFGAGDGQGKNRGYITKDENGLSIYYINSAGAVSVICLNDDGTLTLNNNQIAQLDQNNPIASEYIEQAGFWNKALSGLTYSGTDGYGGTEGEYTVPASKIDSVYAQTIIGSNISTQNFDGDGNYIRLERQYMTFWDASAPTAPKMAMGFVDSNNVGVPGIVLGAGDPNGYGRAYIVKDAGGFKLIYNISPSLISGIKFTNDGKVLINDSEIPPLEDVVLRDEYLSDASIWDDKLAGMRYDATDDRYYYGDKVVKPNNTNHYLKMEVIGDAFCDLALYDAGYSTTVPWFAIIQEEVDAAYGAFALYKPTQTLAYPLMHFGIQNDMANTRPWGVWDFRDASFVYFDEAKVLGLTATAVFG